jgi:hypothetical protein
MTGIMQKKQWKRTSSEDQYLVQNAAGHMTVELWPFLTNNALVLPRFETYSNRSIVRIKLS